MIDPDHAKRVLEHQEGKPVMVIARWLADGAQPSRLKIIEAEDLIETLVEAGYAIELIEDDDD